jgi:hypothetical protein
MDSGKRLLQLSAVERRDYDNAEAIGHRVNFWYKSYKTFYGRNLQMWVLGESLYSWQVECFNGASLG